MYLRTTQRRNKDGSTVRYIQLAHNVRDGASTTAKVLVNLGREDALDMDGLRRLTASIDRYLNGTRGPDLEPLTGPGADLGALSVESSRPIGTAWLLDGLWTRLDIAAALTKHMDGRRFRTDIERIIFAMVAGRAIEPDSKRATAEWAGTMSCWTPPAPTLNSTTPTTRLTAPARHCAATGTPRTTAQTCRRS